MADGDRFPIPRIGIWTGALDTVPASRSRELAA
ncbi:MAG: hypothetical protein QOC75_3679, partial [Pseudonocardiales bacterium]|nr:hypothetical protein [Pseudonocardiales bacterium]